MDWSLYYNGLRHERVNDMMLEARICDIIVMAI